MMPNDTSKPWMPLVVVDAVQWKNPRTSMPRANASSIAPRPRTEVLGAELVVVGADAELGDQQRRAGHDLVQAVEHEPTPAPSIP